MKVVEPEMVGMSSERLARMDGAMERFVADDQMPGILTLVQRKGQVIHVGRHGKMDIEAARAMQDDALFRIYSMTKPIASVALMMLLEDGRFGLDDPIDSYTPIFKKTKVYAGQGYAGLKLVEKQTPITFRHLLTHTAGLSYGFFNDSPVELMYQDIKAQLFQRERPLVETIEMLADLPLIFQPGTGWQYSHATDVVGYMVQVLSDMPFADYLEERVLRPLGMNDTAFHVPAEKLDRLAQIYGSDGLYDPFVLPDPILVRNVATPTSSPSGGGGLVSTMADYLRFCNFLINGGELDGVRLLSNRTLSWMASNHVPAELFPLQIGPRLLSGYGFGLGFRVMMDRSMGGYLSSVGEFGWAGMAKTYFWIDPHEELIGLMMTQYIPAAVYPARNRFPNLVYQALVD